ncbi:MAG: NADH-quinone oxidoreductase subunit C [Candidatus Omnitrophota bacterium]
MEDITSRIKEEFKSKVIKIDEKAPRRIYIDFNPQDIPDVAKFIFKDLGCRFAIASGMDTPQGIEIIYHFSHDHTGKLINVRTLIADKKKPEIMSIAPLIIGAEWIEREMWEMLGINFIGHPNLKRLLLADEWPQGKYPLRKEKT